MPWLHDAIQKIQADAHRSSDTHLVCLASQAMPNIALYLKDESTHPTGSLKHRLARSLFLYALCNRWLAPDTPIIEASSGSTAVSEAYFAKLIGLRFLAVMAKSTSLEKIRRIQHYGGECVFVDNPTEDRACASALAKKLGGHYMDQFTNAERATDWRGNNNIAESIFSQMEKEPHPIPSWIVCGAGTGGTSATIGRYLHYRQFSTKLCVVDPECSAFYDYYQTRDPGCRRACGSGIEGIGRPQVEPSFLPEVVDRMLCVPNLKSIAAIHFLEKVLGRRCGGSTGTNIIGALELMQEMHTMGQSGSVVSLICDGGDLYSNTYYSSDWLREKSFNLTPEIESLERIWQA